MHFLKSKLATSPKYRAEIDGLRALAIIPVLFYHAGLSLFSGGYVGVDVFFVISGFLITSIIANDIGLRRFSVIQFYERRVRRIFPALFAVVLFCIAAGAVLFPPQSFEVLGKSVIALTLFISNIFFRRSADPEGYFDVAAEQQPLLHTWTLSVEEQFYVFFPLGLWLLTKTLKTKARVGVCIVLAFAISFFLSVYAVQHKPLGAFYLLPPRAWELLAGSLCALKLLPQLTNRFLSECIGVIGLALIALTVFFYQKSTPFPGLAALPPCLGAYLVIYSTETGAVLTKRFLSFSPLVSIGLISYSLYLWHWPLIVFSKYFFVGHLSGGQTVAVVLASFIMALLSFEFIETPFRRAKHSTGSTQVVIAGVLASILLMACGGAIAVTEGFPARFDRSALDIIADNIARKTDHGTMQACTHWRMNIQRASEIKSCPLGPLEGTKKILFWGDSHVEQLQLPIKTLYESGGLNGHTSIFAISAGCPIIEGMNLSSGPYHCDSFFRAALERAQQPDVEVVYLGFSTSWALDDGKLCEIIDGRCTKILSKEEAQSIFLDELSKNIRGLKTLGKKVVISLPFPIYDHSIPEVEIHNAIRSKYTNPLTPKEIDSLSFRKNISDVAISAGAVIFDPRATLCPHESCIFETEHISIYSDNSHIAASQADRFRASLREALLGPGRGP